MKLAEKCDRCGISFENWTPGKVHGHIRNHWN